MGRIKTYDETNTRPACRRWLRDLDRVCVLSIDPLWLSSRVYDVCSMYVEEMCFVCDGLGV